MAVASLMLGETDARAYYLRYTPELDEARSRGDLRTNSFVKIEKTMDEDRRRRIGRRESRGRGSAL